MSGQELAMVKLLKAKSSKNKPMSSSVICRELGLSDSVAVRRIIHNLRATHNELIGSVCLVGSRR
jgi:hypothetical protein